MVYVETGDRKISWDNSKGVRDSTVRSQGSEWTPLPNIASDWIRFRSKGLNYLINTIMAVLEQLINLKQNNSIGFFYKSVYIQQ